MTWHATRSPFAHGKGKKSLARERLENLINGIADVYGWRSYRIPRGRGVAGFPNYIMVRGNRMVVAFLATEFNLPYKARPWLNAFQQVEFMDVVVWTDGDEEAPAIELERTVGRAQRYPPER